MKIRLGFVSNSSSTCTVVQMVLLFEPEEWTDEMSADFSIDPDADAADLITDASGCTWRHDTEGLINVCEPECGTPHAIGSVLGYWLEEDDRCRPGDEEWHPEAGEDDDATRAKVHAVFQRIIDRYGLQGAEVKVNRESDRW